MSRPSTGSASYRAVLALPHARGMLAASLLPRLCYGMTGLPLLIALRDGTGSYAVAGLATSLYGLSVALLGPYRARITRGQRGFAFMLLAIGYVLFLTALAVACASHAPAIVDVTLVVLAGLCLLSLARISSAR